MKNLITRGICLALTLVLAFSLVACGTNNGGDTTPTTTAPATSTPETTAPTTTPVAAESGMNFFYLSYGENYEFVKHIMFIDNEDGTFAVDYQGDIRKMGNVDASVMETLAAEFANSGLIELNGQMEWNDGEASGSMSVTYTDEEKSYSADFGGVVPQAFIDAYNVIDAVVLTLIAEIPEYVPQAQVMGEVEDTMLAEINSIITNTSIPQDTLVISEIVKDESFSFATGLSADTGIQNAASVSSMMMTSAYSLVLVNLEEGADAAAIAADFEANLDWLKWVCVQPSNALIAQKDNMILCLMAMDATYTETCAAITAAGWTEVKALSNPNF